MLWVFQSLLLSAAAIALQGAFPLEFPILFLQGNTSVVGEQGPGTASVGSLTCADGSVLVAITNALILRGSLRLPPGQLGVTRMWMVDALMDSLMDNIARQLVIVDDQRDPEEEGQTSRLGLDDLIYVADNLVELTSGEFQLDLDPRSPASFATDENRGALLFEAFGIPLYHAWVFPEESIEYATAQYIGNFSRSMIQYFAESDVAINPVIQNMANTSASEYGLQSLSRYMAPNTISILYTGEHFVRILPP